MRVLIAGGRGFLGRALQRCLEEAGHDVRILTRNRRPGGTEVAWDGRHPGDWIKALQRTDVVVNACGYGLQHWPWTRSQKARFLSSRVDPGRALAAAISKLETPPRTFIQFSGINRYGMRGAPADESTPAAKDFLALLTVQWEGATRQLTDLGVRHVILRNAIVLDSRSGLFPLFCLPCRLFVGGRLGDGSQPLPWIHVSDHARAVRHLIETSGASGAYNLVSPASTTNGEFMRETCRILRRPFWLHLPASLLQLALGEMAGLVLAGRWAVPRRLVDSGFVFEFPGLRAALSSLLRHGGTGHK